MSGTGTEGKVRKVARAGSRGAPLLVTAWFGVALVGPETTRYVPFPAEPLAIARRLALLRNGEVLPEEKEAAAGLDAVRVREARLRGLGSLEAAAPLSVAPPEGYGRDLLHAATLELARIEAKEAFQARDKIVVQKVKAMDELVKTANLLAERLREWYALHAPELTGQVAEHETFARAIAEHGPREAVAAALGLSDVSLIGTDFRETDVASVRSLARTLTGIYDDWKRLEADVDLEMDELGPNLKALLSGPLAARLVSKAGSLQRLASYPASTVQTLGAEGALFRHLREGAKPPKHGLLFQFEAVNRAPPWVRGRIARALASKASLAARADAYGTSPEGDLGRKLAEQMAARVEAIQAAHPTAPPRRSGPRRGRGPRGRPGGFPRRGDEPRDDRRLRPRSPGTPGRHAEGPASDVQESARRGETSRPPHSREPRPSALTGHRPSGLAAQGPSDRGASAWPERGAPPRPEPGRPADVPARPTHTGGRRRGRRRHSREADR